MTRQELEWCRQGICRQMAGHKAEIGRLSQMFDTVGTIDEQRRVTASMAVELQHLNDAIQNAEGYLKALEELNK